MGRSRPPRQPAPAGEPAQPAQHTEPGRRVGIFGGTFDPVHSGHVAAARAVRDAMGLDVVLLVVANDPWKKHGRDVAAASDRLAMVEAAAAGVEGVEASAIEIERGGVSFTADTLAQIAAAEPGAELYLIVGADLLDELDSWERIAEIRSAAHLVVLTRPGWEIPGALEKRWGASVTPVPAYDISSTELRDLLARGDDVGSLVPEAAKAIIAERGLYRRRGGGSAGYAGGR